MRLPGLAIALALLLANPAPAAAAGEIFTLAGTGTAGPVRNGGAASLAGLGTYAEIAPLPAGGFLAGDSYTVWRVDPQGRIHTVAGPGHGKSRFFIGGLAALPGGGVLVVDEDHRTIRMIDPHGVITTVAGGGSSRANGIPATRARLGFPLDVAALPGGGFVFTDAGEDPEADDALVGGTVRRVGPDGRISIVAGTGEEFEFNADLHGQPATTVQITPSAVAVTPDGGLLIADYYAGRVDRVAPGGAITEAASALKPIAVAAEPDGGFVGADNGDQSTDEFSARARVLRVAPDGAITTIAGTGRLLTNPRTGFEHRGDGANALTADLHDVSSLALMPDGGILFAEGGLAAVREDGGSLVRYIAPAAPGVLAAALDRDHDRVVAHGGPTAVNVTTTLPATIALSLDGRTTRAAVGAGTTRIALPSPPSGARPRTLALMATDSAGRRAEDRLRLYPPAWLPDEAGRLAAAGVASTVLRGGAISGDGVGRCRRFGAARVDCAIDRAGEGCHIVASVSLAHGRLRWGTYPCGLRAHPRYRRRPRPLRRKDWTCRKADAACPPAWFGKLGAGALVPSS